MYLDLAKELRKLRNMRVVGKTIMMGHVRIVSKNLERGLEELKIEGRIKRIQTSALLRLARILRKVLET